MKADRFAKVAKLLTKGEAVPDRLVMDLAFYSLPIGARKTTNDDDRDDRKLLEAAQHLDHWLRIHTIAQDDFGSEIGFELPDEVEAVVQALPELIDYLQDQLRKPRKGGPSPDGRRMVCADVCAGYWRQLHGEVQPYSHDLQKACEAYWQACGNPETPAALSGHDRNWESFLLRAKQDAEAD